MTKDIRIKHVIVFVVVLLIILLLYNMAGSYNDALSIWISKDAVEIWHDALEILTIIMGFSILIICINIFVRNKNIRILVLIATFAFVVTYNYIHLIFFDLNNAAGADEYIRSQLFWVQARLILSIGLVAYGLIPSDLIIKKGQKMTMTVYSGIFVMLAVSVLILFNVLPSIYANNNFYIIFVEVAEYIIIVLYMVALTVYIRHYMKSENKRSYFMIVMAVLFSIWGELAHMGNSEVIDVFFAMGYVLKVLGYFFLYISFFILNVRQPYDDLKDMQRQLSYYTDDLQEIVMERTSEITKVNTMLNKNLDDARLIQTAMQPKGFPKIDGVKFASKYVACEDVGGDFFNVFKLDDDHVGLLMGDVAGHGVSAAMINVFINQRIDFVNRSEKKIVYEPSWVLKRLYRDYNAMSFPEEIYVVLFYAIYNIRTGILTYSSAGMNVPPIIVTPYGNVKPIEMSGFPICNFGEIFTPDYENTDIQLDHGDILVMYTDGLVEYDRMNLSINDSNYLNNQLKGWGGGTPEETCDYLYDSYKIMLEDRAMPDDVTILVMGVDME